MDERPEPIDRDPEGGLGDGPEGDIEHHLEDGAGSTAGDGTTGVAEVDRVLADVAAVSGAPVSEHVAVFERAHDQLRRALDAVPEPRPDQHQGT